MSNDDIAIKVDAVAKNFVLPHKKPNSIKSVFTGFYSKNVTNGDEIQHALRDVSFEIKKGEFFGIVGRNGSGKSTLLKILAGIYQPTTGRVYTQGKLVPFIELGVGFNPELTGRENVYLNGAMLGFSEDEISAMYNDIVEFAELERFMDQKLKNYSSGMQVRLAFSMATRADADILLIDEVLAVGDADFQRKCYNYFKSLKKNKKTVVFVSHDMDAVREFCDRAMLVDSSELKSIGDTREISEKYSELFLSTTKKSSNNQGKNLDDREGNAWAQVVEVASSQSVYKPGDELIQFSVSIEAKHEHTNLMTGFTLKDAEGRVFNGTNTWEIHHDLPSVKVGEKCIVKWTLPNVYEDGFYTVDVYVYGGQDNTKFDQINDATSFQVKRPKRSGGLIAPPTSIEVI